MFFTEIFVSLSKSIIMDTMNLAEKIHTGPHLDRTDTREFIKNLSKMESMIESGEESNKLFRLEEKLHSMTTLPVTNSTFYKPVEAGSFPISNYIYTETGNVITHFFEAESDMDTGFDSAKAYDGLIANGYNVIFSKDCAIDKKHWTTEYILEKKTKSGYIVISLSPIEYKNTNRVDRDNGYCYVHSNGDVAEYQKAVDIMKSAFRKLKVKINNVHLVMSTQRGYTTAPFELPQTTLDIQLNYGKDFVPIHTKIITQLNKTKGKGLVLLHGVPGTGKTHYLKYLASKIEGKRVLFIPPYLADFITSPEMTPFLIQNSDSVLFIEDAERVITDRNTNGSTGVSNILNLTDGILSDILNIQIVATFNMDKRKIDTALLRKGRLIAEHKFDALPADDAQNLINHLGISHTTTTPMTLTEIYNINEAEYKSEEPTRIGFKY